MVMVTEIPNGWCTRCQQRVHVVNGITAVHHYRIDDRRIKCPRSGAVQLAGAVVTLTQSEGAPKRRKCNSCNGTGQVKSGRDKNDNVIWVTCQSCNGAGEI